MREFMCRVRPRAVAVFLCIIVLTAHSSLDACAEESSAPPRRFDILEYDVSGNTVLEPEIIGQACAPYLGPARAPEDVDQARAALEKVYRQRGYKTVSVSIPQQTVREGVVRLEVVEGKVAHLNVVGSKFHSIDRIKAQVPSLAEGSVPNFVEVEHDLAATNQDADRRVTPALKAGAAPGTVDVDLVVDDDLPLHGSVELNNRESQDTRPLRALVSLQYDNLWQRGHSLSVSAQVAPQNRSDAQVFYGSYLARLTSRFSLLFSALRSDSNVSTVGGTNVVGNGEVFGLRAVWALPVSEHFFSSVSFGLDYKRFRDDIALEGNRITTPIRYYPLALDYTGVVHSGAATTQFSLGARLAFSGLGSDSNEFGLNRAFARPQQLSFRASFTHSRELYAGIEGRVRIHGQITDQPLISNEQFSAGGLDSVRGYLEAEVLGDSGWDASLELRSPSMLTSLHFIDELRFYGFIDDARLFLRQPLPDQRGISSIASTGTGLDLRLWHKFDGALVWALPFHEGPTTKSGHSRWLFRVSASF